MIPHSHLDRIHTARGRVGVTGRGCPAKWIVLLAILFASGTAAPLQALPNVVMIVTDDQGWGDVGYHTPPGEVPIQTPVMDSFAVTGIRLEKFYATAVCSVTRSCLLTGRNSLRTGTNNTRGVPLDEHLMPQTFRAAGFQTFLCGKWHLGGSDKNRHYLTVNGTSVRIIQEGLEYAPYHRGWDSHYGQYSGAINYYTHDSAETDNPDKPDWWLNGIPQDGPAEHSDSQGNGGWSPDLLADKAIEHIRGRDPSRPMLLYLAFNSVHGPVSAPPALLAKYQSLGITSSGRRSIAAAIEGTDRAMGRVLTALESEGIAGNTVVVWFSDNGGDETKGSLNDPLRGSKGDGYDGAIHGVAGIRWPGVLPAGVISQQYIWVGDLFPTLCAATGVVPRNTKPFDGINLWPALLGAANDKAVARPSPLVTATAIPCAIHGYPDPVHGGTRMFKLIRNRIGQQIQNELYNLSDDPAESVDLLQQPNAASYSGIAATLASAISSISAETPPPYIGPPLITHSVTAGSTITLYAPFTSYRPPSVQWRRSAVPIPGGSMAPVMDAEGNTVTGAYTTTLTIVDAGNADAGAYDVVVSNSSGSTTSAQGMLSILPTATPRITGVSSAPTAPTYLDEVTVLAKVDPPPGGTVTEVLLSYETGIPLSRTVFRESFNAANANPWTGTGSQNPWKVSAASPSHLRQAVGASNRTNPIALTPCTTNGTTLVSCPMSSLLWPGLRITGPSIAAGTMVTKVNGADSFELSAPSTGSATGLTLTAAGVTLTGAVTNASTLITCSSTTGLLPGMSISGPGIPGNVTVASVLPDGRSFLLNTAATGQAANLTLVAAGAAAEFQTGTANLTDSMFATALPINCSGSAGYVEFHVQTRDMLTGDQWTFQTSIDEGATWQTRIAEATAANHGFLPYRYNLTEPELGTATLLRFQFAGHVAIAPARPPRVDIDDITVATTTMPPALSIPMHDDGRHGDGAAGDGIYGAQIARQPGGTTVVYRIGATASGGGVATSPPTGSFGYHVNQSLTDAIITNAEFLGIPSDRSMTVNFVASADVEAYVEYGTSALQFSESTTPALYPASSGAAEITLSGLSPDTVYHYRVRYRTPGSPWYLARGSRSFRTARMRSSPFRFTVTADPHLDVNTDPALLTRTIQNLAADQPDFHIDLGDIFMTDKMADGTQILPVHGGGVLPTEARVRQRASILRSFFEHACHGVPYFYVLGNHEAEYGYGFNAAPDKQNNIPAWNLKARKLLFPTPVPSDFYTGNSSPLNYPGGSLGLLENYYAWEWGDALFIVLDPFWNTTTNPNQQDDAWQWSLGQTQYHWLRSTLQNSSAAYRFIFLHHLIGGSTTLADGTTPQAAARGGIEVANRFEWGGRNADGITDGFAARRPGWGIPIHDLLVQNRVHVVFHGHDHFYACQNLGGITYLECPQPGTANFTTLGSAADGKYREGTLLPNSGHIRVTVEAGTARCEYVRAFRPQDENPTRHNGDISHAFSLRPIVFPPIEMLPATKGERSFRWNSQPGIACDIQWSQGLGHWQTIATVTPAAVTTNSVYTDRDPARIQLPSGFYRVRCQP